MKNILITGISRGLGLELSRHFLEKGDHVIGISRTKSEEINELTNQYPTLFIWKKFDLVRICEDENSIKEAIPLDTMPLDAFIDNAAILYKDLIHKIDIDKMSKMFDVNTIAPIILTKLVLNNFLRFKKEGAIVHISSICAHKAFNGLSMIGATKAAIEAFSRAIAYEYGRFGIRSNTIVAGLLDIGMRNTVSTKLTEELKAITAMRKLVDTQSILDLTDYLISDENHCITGQNIHINAGII